MNKIDISVWLDNFRIQDYTINADFTVDVHGAVNLAKHGIKEIPFQFNIVDSDFLLQENELTSLKGFPFKVKGNCDCSKNKLSDLLFCPKEVGGYFYQTLSVKPRPSGRGYKRNTNCLCNLQLVY